MESNKNNDDDDDVDDVDDGTFFFFSKRNTNTLSINREAKHDRYPKDQN